jgi:alpha-beta hydrolase superfamily lysophospholipase
MMEAIMRKVHERVFTPPTGPSSYTVTNTADGCVHFTNTATFDIPPNIDLEFALLPVINSAVGVPTLLLVNRNPGGPLHDKVVLYSHGNADDLGRILPYIFHLSATLGCAVMAYDYRGYGHAQAPGKYPTETSCYEDAEAVLQYLVTNKGYAEAQIILFGRSLGCAMAVEGARLHGRVAAVVLESPFLSILEAGGATVLTYVPMFPNMFNNREKAEQVVRAGAAPVLILHGTADKLIPVYHGEELAIAFRAHLGQRQDRLTLVLIHGAEHNNMCSAEFHGFYMQALTDFLFSIPLFPI